MTVLTPALASRMLDVIKMRRRYLWPTVVERGIPDPPRVFASTVLEAALGAPNFPTDMPESLRGPR